MTERNTIALPDIVASDNPANDVESRLLSHSSSNSLASRCGEDNLNLNLSIPTLESRLGFSTLEECRDESPATSEGSLLVEPVIVEPALEPEAALNRNLPSHLKDITFCSLSVLTPWFPKVDPAHPRARTWRTWRSRRQVVLWTCFTTAGFICITNFILFGVARSKFKGISDGVVTLFRGECASVRWWDRGIHTIINILGTLLLGASNITLQLIAAPTREEVDRAHSRGVWLDIGVPSFKNLRNISRTNFWLWCCLTVSSLPIHFLYNSAVFSSLTINEFGYAVVTEDFLTGSAWNLNTTNGRGPVTSGSSADNTAVEIDSFSFVTYLQKDYQGNSIKYQNLTILECLNAYSESLHTAPNLLLVSSDQQSSGILNSSLLSWGFHNPTANNITRSPICTLSYSVKQCRSLSSLSAENLGDFRINNFSVSYCLNRPSDPLSIAAQTCYLQCSPLIILIVAIFNAFKCICILSVMLWKREPTLSILGDAIASFLSQPDEYTKNLGITSRMDIVRSNKDWSGGKGVCLKWQSRPNRWLAAATNRRWMFTVIASILLIVAGLVLLAIALYNQSDKNRSISLKSLLAEGFGTPNSDTIIQFHQRGLIVNSIRSNIWQVLLSLLYMLHNALLSCMMVAREWNGFITERKTLRVSSPKGIQRSSYFVSMPLRYGIPMMILFATEHWLLSQSAFIIQVIRTDWLGLPTAEWTISGFSFSPALLAIIVSVLMLLAQLLHGYLRSFSNESSMPLVSTCSAAISANCHRPEADKEAHLLPVQWGVTGKSGSESKLCSFTTSRYVEAPTPNCEYLTYRKTRAEAEGDKLPWTSRVLQKSKDLMKDILG